MFRNLLLNKVNHLALTAYLQTPLERDMLDTICDYKLTPAPLTRLTTLFHPREFGGSLFFLDHTQENLSAAFTESIARPANLHS